MYRRNYLKAAGLAIGTPAFVGKVSGAESTVDVPPLIREASVGASNDAVSDVPADAIDVRDHGAQLNGDHDDHDAIQSALNEAAESDDSSTVYVPEGTVLLEDELVLRARHSGTTLRGAGRDTELRLSEDFESPYRALRVDGRRTDEAVTDVTVSDLRINGQKNEQSDWGFGIVTFEADGETEGVLFSNLWVHDFLGSNIHVNTVGTTIRNVSTWGANKWHGIGISCDIDEPSRPIVVEGSHSAKNDIHGIDCSGGHTVVRRTLCEQNSWGAKNTSDTLSATWQNVVFRDNEELGYMTAGGHGNRVTFKNVVAEGNGRKGMLLGHEGEYHLDTLILRGNNTSGRSNSNIYITSAATIRGTELRSYDAKDGVGLAVEGEPEGQLDRYVHAGNEEGPLSSTYGIDILADIGLPIGSMEQDTLALPDSVADI